MTQIQVVLLENNIKDEKDFNYYIWSTFNSIYTAIYNNRIIMEKIKVTMKEIYEAMKPSVQKNKKKYTRKIKHRKNEKENIK